MAVEDELRLDFQGEDSSMSSTAAKVVSQINTLDSSINKLINSFNTFSQVSSSAESGMSHFSKSTSGLEEIGSKIEKMTESFNNLNPAIENLSNSFNDFNSASDSVENLKQKIESKKAAIESDTRATEEAKNKADSLKNSNKGLSQSFTEIATSVGSVYGLLKKWTLGAADATRAQTRFNAVFDSTNGELAEARKWVDWYSDSLYLDSIEVENAISKFRVLTNSMGMNNEKSKEMSFNMTQLAYDLKAVSGNDISQTVNQLTSALSGQTKALSEYGIAIDNNTMQQYLNAHGIDRKVASLNEAERAEVRYMKIMEGSAGIQGYYAKTLMSPANALNIIKTQFGLLAREIGNVFIPILMALVPIVVTVTKALRSLAQALASFFGIKIDFNDYSEGLSLMADGVGGIGDTADSTSKKVKNMLRDFDDLHVVDFGDDSASGSGGTGGTGAGLGGGQSLFDPVEYADWSKFLDNMVTKLSEAEWWVKAIAAGIAGFTIGKIIGQLLEFLGLLDKGKGLAFALSAALAGIGFTLTFDAAKDILQNGLNSKNILETIGGAITAGAGAALMFKTMGASAILSAKIGLIITLGLIAFNMGLGIGEWINEKLGDKYDYYIKEFNLDVNEDSVGEQAVKVVKILFKSIHDALTEKFSNFDQVMSDLGRWIIMGIIVGMATAIIGLPAAILGLIVLFLSIIVDTLENVFQIHSPSKVMLEYGTYIILGLLEGIKSLFNNVIQIFIDLKDAIIEKIVQLKTDLNKKITEIKDNLVNKFNEIKINITNKITEIKTNVSNKFEDIKNSIKTKIEGAKDIVKNAIDKIKSFLKFDWKLPNIKMPHFGIEWNTSGMSGKAFQKLGFPGLPKIKVDWYAEGGFPDKGQLFIANEREPELIGSMGNRSVVANNAQITEGIAQASYGAFKQALSEMGQNFGGDTVVYVGDTQITDVITKKKKIQDKRFGR